MSNNKPTIDQIMRLHRLTVKSFFDMQSLTNAEKEELNELERQFGMLDHIEIMNREIEQLKKEIEQLTAALKVAEEFIKKSHHRDGCAHRYGKDCDCGKFEIQKGLG